MVTLNRGESVYELLGIDTKTIYYGGSQCCRTELTGKVLEYIGIEHCNSLPTPTSIEASLGIDDNGSEAIIDWYNSYASLRDIYANLSCICNDRYKDIVASETTHGIEDFIYNFWS